MESEVSSETWVVISGFTVWNGIWNESILNPFTAMILHPIKMLKNSRKWNFFSIKLGLVRDVSPLKVMSDRSQYFESLLLLVHYSPLAVNALNLRRGNCWCPTRNLVKYSALFPASEIEKRYKQRKYVVSALNVTLTM